MKITFLDTETTGLSYEKGDQLIEVCLITVDSDARTALAKFEKRIKPTVPISADAQKIHGIAIEDLSGCTAWELVAPTVWAVLADSDLLVAHNMDFDGPFLAHELVRVGQKVPSKPTYCTMKNGRWACFDGKQPKLEELCFALNIPYDKAEAHAALYDTERLMECYFKMTDRGLIMESK